MRMFFNNGRFFAGRGVGWLAKPRANFSGNEGAVDSLHAFNNGRTNRQKLLLFAAV
jgi:hypothetical protein